MRGRKPNPFRICPADEPDLLQIARSQGLPWFQVQLRSNRLGGLRAAGPGPWPINCSAMRPRFGEPAIGIEPTASPGCTRSTAGKNVRGDWPRFPPLQRAQIVELACLEPLARGLHITHWSSEDLAGEAVADGIVVTISPRTIRRILDDVDLQPHRTRYRRTTRAMLCFKERAEKVLWCYANAERLAAHGSGSCAIDEMPDCQVLERVPIRRDPWLDRAGGVRLYPTRHGQHPEFPDRP